MNIMNMVYDNNLDKIIKLFGVIILKFLIVIISLKLYLKEIIQHNNKYQNNNY
jgi:hypothetical protein